MAVLKLLTRFTRWLWLLVATVVIGYAVMVVLGRMLLPSLDDYRPELTGYLSEAFGINVEIDRLSGAWPRLTPIISANQVAIRLGEEADSGIQIGEVNAELSPFLSIWQRQLIWQQLNLKQVKLHLVEDAEGRWSIAGFPVGGEGGSSIKPLEILFYSSLISIDRVELVLDFYSGTELALAAEDILVENSEDFHRILANLLSADGDEVARFVFEASGDHNDPDNFDAAGYLRLNQINIGGGLNAVARQWFPSQLEKIGTLKANVDTEIWFDVRADGQADIVGRFHSDEIPLKWAVDLPSLTGLNADLVGWYRPGTDWGVTLQSLDFEWGDEDIKPLDIRFGQRVGARWGEFGLDINHFNIGVARDLLLKTNLLSEKLHDTITQISPEGLAERVSVDFSGTEDSPSILMRAQLTNLAVNPWKGAPGLTGVDGYLEMSQANGLFILDSKDLTTHYAKLYDIPMQYDRASGAVSWHWDKERSEVSVVSGPLSFAGEQGTFNAQLYLDIPINRPDDAPQMFLQVGARDTHSRHRDSFIPDNLSPGLTQWLDEAIGDTHIQEVGVIFRGSLRSGQSAHRTLQMFLNLDGGHLKYHADWPALDNYSGRLVLNGSELEGYVSEGKLGEVSVTGVDLTLKKVGREQRNTLFIKATGTAGSGGAYDLLNNSPLSNQISKLADWQLGGQLKIRSNLQIPLGSDWRSGKYDVAADIRKGMMVHQGFGLDMTDMTGTLTYDLTNGLAVKNIKGKLWGSPMDASLKTGLEGLRINVKGELDVNTLAERYGWKNNGVISGKTLGHGALIVPSAEHGGVPRIEFQSDLKGIDVQLPKPFAKTAVEARNFSTRVELGENLIISMEYGSHIRAGYEMADGVWRRGYLGINRSDLRLPEGEELLLAADIDTINLVDWQTDILAELGTGEGSVTGMELPPVRFDLRVGEFGVSDLALSRVHLTGDLRQGMLHAELESPMASGKLDIPIDNDQEMTIALSHLKLPEPQPGDEEDRDLFDPRTLRTMRFSVDHLTLGDRELGQASFRLEASEFGLTASNIDANLYGLKIGGEGSDTQLAWHYDGSEHNTEFRGLMQSTDMAAVLENFGVGRVLDSDNAHFRSDLRWLGRPWEITQENLEGQVIFALEEGKFYQNTGGGTNAFIRIVGLFNFETWLRRLKLDFSDFYSKGISYDNISGSLIFDKGLLNFPDPIVAEMPSGKMQMQGSIDMLNEQIDSRLVATLPVGTNLPWIAALAINLPAAAGVWVVSKMFKKQVDNLSSISYRIKGSWDEPDMSVERVFSDQNRAEKKKEQRAQKKAKKEAEKARKKEEES